LEFQIEEPFCKWLTREDEGFRLPFFEDGAMKSLTVNSRKQNFKSISSLELLPYLAAECKDQVPDLIVFHSLRCGSTLLSQLLAAIPTHKILAEVPFFDKILQRILPTVTALLQAAIRIYGGSVHLPEKKIIIKTDSWHLAYYDPYRKLYPDTPVLLLYRNPTEVMASKVKKTAMHAVPGLLLPHLFGLTIREVQKWISKPT
jgi:hypothetical protein